MSRLQVTNEFGVDAVLPADGGWRPERRRPAYPMCDPRERVEAAAAHPASNRRP